MTTRADPFAVLAIAPTLDPAIIKRAYFTLLSKHPPHADPEGFRRLRDAYELLSGPSLFATWAAARIDVERELELVERELGSAIAHAKREREAREATRQATAAFEGLLRLDLASARRRAGLAG